MLFLPFKVDLDFNRLPVITVLICLICIVIYTKQESSFDEVRTSIAAFCANQNEYKFNLVVKKISGADSNENCQLIFYYLYRSKDRKKTIDEFIKNAQAFDGYSREYGDKLIKETLNRKIENFERHAIKNLTDELSYDPRSFSMLNMVTAAFAHGSWVHLIGNLFFFIAFATSIEAVLGSGKYLVFLLALALGTHLTYSLALMGVENPLPTVGLSGVVMGMIGMFAYLMPTVKIKCFLWFIWIIKIIRVPAWILAVWYIGWDIYGLYHSDDSNVNFIAHVSGAGIGFLAGFIFLKKRRRVIQKELKDSYSATSLSKALNR